MSQGEYSVELCELVFECSPRQEWVEPLGDAGFSFEGRSGLLSHPRTALGGRDAQTDVAGLEAIIHGPLDDPSTDRQHLDLDIGVELPPPHLDALVKTKPGANTYPVTDELLYVGDVAAPLRIVTGVRHIAEDLVRLRMDERRYGDRSDRVAHVTGFPPRRFGV